MKTVFGIGQPAWGGLLTYRENLRMQFFPIWISSDAIQVSGPGRADGGRTMSKRAFAVAAATLVIALPTASLAQSAYTNCNTAGSFTNCNTNYSPPYNGGGAMSGFANGFSRGLERGSSFGERIAVMRAERRQRNLYREVGKLVAAGRCPEARTQALGAGDFELAQKVDAVCAAPAPQPQP